MKKEVKNIAAEAKHIGTYIKKQLLQSLPCIANLILALLIEQICLVFSGHLDEEESMKSFGALGISLFTINTFCLSFGSGVLGATDTLASKAFGNDDKETA